ncbi:MAG: DUF2079 domain-containing protein [Anaerolineae bacterium]|nr:DUF2079 domain-containing protein [Anaerolineae bacterium]
MILILLIMSSFLMMAWLSTAKYHGYNLQSFDLGNMSQAIWSVSQGKPLVFTTEGIEWSRLSLHVELFYFLLAPFYALRPSPDTLLIIQAAFYTLGAWPLYRFAYRRLAHEGAALALVATYLLFPIGQTAVLFHFHGDTLALPFLLFAIDAMDQKAWSRYAMWLILSLSCKFYVAVPVAIMGGVLWLKGERKAGMGTVLLAGMWGIVAFLLIRPLFATPEAAQTGASISYYLDHYFNQFFTIDHTFLARLSNGLIVFAPVLLLAIRAPLWLLPAVAVALPVMFSNGPGPSYDYRYHHYVLVVPFLMTAAVFGLASLRQKAESANPPQKWHRYAWITVVITLIFSSLLVSTPLSPLFYLAESGSGLGNDETGYRQTPRDTFKDTWLAEQVPPDAPLTASDQLGFRLVNRPVFYRNHMKFKEFAEILPAVEFAVVDSLNDFALGTPDEILEGRVSADHPIITQLMTNPEFKLLNAQDGLLLFGKKGEAVAQTIDVQDATSPLPALAQFDNLIALIDVQIVPQGNNRYHFTYTWQALAELNGRSPLIAVSHLAEIPHARIVHLPTLALAPTTSWVPNQIIIESFEIELPDNISPGEYPLSVGWYDTSSLFAAQTNEQSRIGNDFLVGSVTIP